MFRKAFLMNTIKNLYCIVLHRIASHRIASHRIALYMCKTYPYHYLYRHAVVLYCGYKRCRCVQDDIRPLLCCCKQTEDNVKQSQNVGHGGKDGVRSTECGVWSTEYGVRSLSLSLFSTSHFFRANRLFSPLRMRIFY